MNTLTQAQQFLEQAGRDIDRARYAYHFGSLAQDELLAVLARYQNPDGGFGHGLEPDIQAPDSNPCATEHALQICLLAGVSADHPLLQRCVVYLEQTQHPDGGWRLSPAIYQHPLAPWFQDWQWPNLNPACTLAGLLHELGLGSAALQQRVARLIEALTRVEDLTGDEFYAVRPYAALMLADPDTHAFSAAGVLWWLIRQHVNNTLDGSHFFEYVRGPDSYTGRQLLGALLTARLAALAAEQATDGGWPTPYDSHWRGHVTVQNLLVLRAFKQI